MPDDLDAALYSTEKRVAELEKIQAWLRRRVRIAGCYLASDCRTWGESANAMVEYVLGGEFPDEDTYPRDGGDMAACKRCRDSCPYSLVEKMDEVLKVYKERLTEYSKEDEDA